MSCQYYMDALFAPVGRLIHDLYEFAAVMEALMTAKVQFD